MNLYPSEATRWTANQRLSFLSLLFFTFSLVAMLYSTTASAAASLTGSGRVDSHTFNAGNNQSYEVYVPTSYDPSTPAPMLMALHGCVMDNMDALRAWNLDVIADQNNVIVVFPYVGNIPMGRNEDCWGYWEPAHIREGAGEVRYVYEVAQQVEQQYSIDSDRRFITGISSGGGMTVASAIAYNNYWTAAAPVAGLPYGDWSVSVVSDMFKQLPDYVSAIEAELNYDRAVPTLVVQSSNDTTVMPRAMELIRDSQLTVWGEDLIADATDSCSKGGVNCTLTTYNGPDGTPVVRTMLYNGGPGRTATYGSGHYWTGGDDDLTVWSNDSDGPNAAEQMWAFFEEVAGGKPPAHCENDSTAPAAPTGLSLVGVVNNSADLSLNANGESDLRGYRVYSAAGAQLTSSIVASTSIGLSGLAANTDYTIYATAVDDCGNESAASNQVSFTTGQAVVECPPGVSGTASEHYVAGRLGLNEYLAMGTKYGYMTSFMLYDNNGSWTDEPGCDGPRPTDPPTPTDPPVITDPGSWTTEPSLAGTEVHIYTPRGTTSNGKRALMITLHGCDYPFVDPNDVVMNHWGWADEADQYGMVVAAPYVPNGGAQGLQCWDYYGLGQNRSNKHNDNLIALANGLIANSSLNIDPDQVYLSGLSSGGAQTFLTGCLAPDVFAGLGISAGPSLGTGAYEIANKPGGVTPSVVEDRCDNFAGSNRSHFSTQIASVIHGSLDRTVDRQYSVTNANALALTYGVSKDSGTSSVPGGGTQETWSDAEGVRVSYTLVNGLDHAWPAGNDEVGGSYTDHATIDYPAFLTKFLFDNNRRADFGSTDSDGDGIADDQDNCPSAVNPDQADADNDGLGDVCDSTPNGPDSDGDGVPDLIDNCPTTPNADQSDEDGNGIGDACDTGVPLDSDGDGVVDADDNCPAVANPGQEDNDGDGIGNACDDTPNGPDADGDGVTDAVDNCPNTPNADQADSDGDGVGDACDTAPSCEEVTAYNYYHKTAGRAYSSGYYWAPDYFAQGSDDPLAGSTWGTTTLHSTSSGVWSSGACPN